jgi:uncharacterized hydrophobic protein (TIGR00271 family)
MGRRLEKLIDWFDLRAELEDHDFIHETITQGIVFRGTNLWILMFAIMVCSVGLNMNSTAVIIGAMLISPLMGPINGMGYGLATYDFPLFERSLKNLAFALGVSLLTSAFYFILSPLNEAHSELLARTSPSIYDVIIAFFGGLAGIVAVSSKFKGNVIPGVAIATALMPPICTAGYGLATLQWNFFFGALYLFTINTVFIAFAVLIVCRLLKFPIRSIVDPEKKRKVTHGITVIILATFVPSIFFGYRLVKKEEFSRNSRAFIDAVALLEGNYLQGNRVNPSTGTVELFYSGYGLSDSLIAVIKERALAYRLAMGEEKKHIYRTLLGESLLIGVIGSAIGTALGIALTLYLQENGFDYSAAMENVNMMIDPVIRSRFTPSLYYIGFIPGVISMLVGSALAGTAVYKRNTAMLFKELD